MALRYRKKPDGLVVLAAADNEALRAVNRLTRLLELVGEVGASPTCRHCGLGICRVQRGKVWAHHDTLSVIIHRAQRLGCAVSHDPKPEDEA